jgi:hypothetical protein
VQTGGDAVQTLPVGLVPIELLDAVGGAAMTLLGGEVSMFQVDNFEIGLCLL